MIFKNAELYNVVELEDTGNGVYNMLRVPKVVESKLSAEGQVRNKNCCGTEIRFNLNGDSAKIKLRLPKGSPASRALVYYGSIPSGWQECIKDIYDFETEIIISNPYDKVALERITEENKLPFDSKLIRVMLEYKNIQIIDITGAITPPTKDQIPSKRYLAYGSSITHGSIGLHASNTYANRTAERLGADLINLGFAGSAKLEPGMANYIASRKDWDFATLEMGINVIDIDAEDYRKRIKYFISTVAKSHLDKKIFCIDLFYTHSDFMKNGRAEMFRQIMRETIEELSYANVIYINGLRILDSVLGLSSDLVHPTSVAIPQMAENLSNIMRGYLQ